MSNATLAPTTFHATTPTAADKLGRSECDLYRRDGISATFTVLPVIAKDQKGRPFTDYVVTVTVDPLDVARAEANAAGQAFAAAQAAYRARRIGDDEFLAARAAFNAANAAYDVAWNAAAAREAR